MKVRLAISKSLHLLNRRDRRLLILAMILQMMSSLLDLAGVLILGAVGALAVSAVQSQPPPEVIALVASQFGLADLSDQELVGLLAIVAAILLLTKTVFSALFTRRVFAFLANRQALVAGKLAGQLLSKPLLTVHRRSSQEVAYALIQGTGAATLSLLGQLVILVTELSVLFVLGGALLVLYPWITLAALGFFSMIALALQWLMGGWATRLGQRGADTDIASLSTLQDALASYREIVVLGRRGPYLSTFQELRWRSASVMADRSFLSQVPKYVFEVAMVLGGIALAGALFMTQDSAAAVGTLALYLAAGSRIMPSLLRMQGATLTMRDNAATAATTYDLAAELDQTEVHPLPTETERRKSSLNRSIESTPAPVSVELRNLGFRYPDKSVDAIDDVTLSIPPGTSLALTGKSGAGKSTLADVMLGVLEARCGDVQLNGQKPRDFIHSNPGAIGYVPQHVSLVMGSIQSNVALGLPRGEIPDSAIWRALDQAQLGELVRDFPDGLDTPIGERGMKLSGGQRQRLGLARALLLNPSLLVLDEATSALDAETESDVTESVARLRGKVTLVVIAHRLSTVRAADSVVYMEAGRIVAQGSFEAVRESVPALARQAGLMGL